MYILFMKIVPYSLWILHYNFPYLFQFLFYNSCMLYSFPVLVIFLLSLKALLGRDLLYFFSFYLLALCYVMSSSLLPRTKIAKGWNVCRWVIKNSGQESSWKLVGLLLYVSK